MSNDKSLHKEYPSEQPDADAEDVRSAIEDEEKRAGIIHEPREDN